MKQDKVSFEVLFRSSSEYYSQLNEFSIVKK